MSILKLVFNTFAILKNKVPHITLLLVVVFSLNLIWQATTILHFYVNQAEIEANHCENIDRPAIQCHGKCYLLKQLKVTQTNDDPINKTTLRTGLIFFAFVSEITTDRSFKTTTYIADNSPLVSPVSAGFSSTLIQPPEFAFFS